MMSDGTGIAEAVIAIEMTAIQAFCSGCGTQAEAHDRVRLDVRDLACFGRPTRLVWSKRRWRCVEAECPERTWTETSEHVPARSVLTSRVCRKPAVRWASSPVP